MAKATAVTSIRIPYEDYDFIKKMGCTPAEIWRIGFDKWTDEFPEKLAEKLEKYQNLVIHCNTKLSDFNSKSAKKAKKLDEICKNFIELRGRPEKFSDFDSGDFSWLKSRIENHDLDYSIEFIKKRIITIGEEGAGSDDGSR